MAKRFIGTDIWQQDWFLDMPNEYKLFWNYVLAECDHVGIFKVNIRTFSSLIGHPIDTKKALEFFNTEKIRVREIKSNLWFIEDFICFQYGHSLNPKNRVHDSILKGLALNNIELNTIRGLNGVNLGSNRPLNDPKEGVKDKDKDKDINKELVLTKKRGVFRDMVREASALKPGTYSKALLEEFYEHWTEPTKSRTKLKWEIQDTWDTPKRLATWLRNDDKWNKNTKPSSEPVKAFVLGQKHNAAG